MGIFSVFAEKIVNRLEHRLVIDNPIVKAFRVFIPNESMLTFNGCERLQFGVVEIKHLYNTYVTTFNLNLEELLKEWEDFKVWLNNVRILRKKMFFQRLHLFQAAKKLECEKQWITCVYICCSNSTYFPNLSKICKVLVTLNVQNATVERGFRLNYYIFYQFFHFN